MSEISKSRKSRGMLRTNTAKALDRLGKYLESLEKKEAVAITIAEMGSLEGLNRRTRETLGKYEESIVRCLDLEDVP